MSSLPPAGAPGPRSAEPATGVAIETSGLRKAYGSKLAVADLTLRVSRGEVFGFLGPNGAGKSTAVKMLLGLVRSDAGSASVLGRPPRDVGTKARIGFLPEHFRFHEWLRGEEFLDLHARLYGMDRETRRRRVPELLQLVGLAGQARLPLSSFSKGMLQRIGLAQALLNDPELLFLDEPTSALDPLGRILVRGILHDLGARGTTVFLNSHLLSEVEATCDRVCFIKEGRVLRSLALRGTDAGLLRVELRVEAVTPALLAALDGFVPAGSSLGSAGEGGSAGPAVLEITLREESQVPELAARVVASGARLYGLTPRRTSLEELFLEVVGPEDSGR